MQQAIKKSSYFTAWQSWQFWQFPCITQFNSIINTPPNKTRRQLSGGLFSVFFFIGRVLKEVHRMQDSNLFIVLLPFCPLQQGMECTCRKNKWVLTLQSNQPLLFIFQSSLKNCHFQITCTLITHSFCSKIMLISQTLTFLGITRFFL